MYWSKNYLRTTRCGSVLIHRTQITFLCREKSNKGKSNAFLEHDLIKYLIDQIEFLREIKLSLPDEQNFSDKNVQINKSSNKVDNESVFHNCSPQGPCFKENSNDLNENIINIFDELNNASTLKDDFRQPCNKIFIDSNSESIIDFNVDPQFNRLTWEINDSNNFDSVKQIDGENNKVILDSNKRNDNNDNNNSIEQNNDADIPLGNSGVKRINYCNNNLIDEPIENFICSDLDVIEKPKEEPSLIVTLISSKILMRAMEIKMMIAMKILLYQILLYKNV